MKNGARSDQGLFIVEVRVIRILSKYCLAARLHQECDGEIVNSLLVIHDWTRSCCTSFDHKKRMVLVMKRQHCDCYLAMPRETLTGWLAG